MPPAGRLPAPGKAEGSGAASLLAVLVTQSQRLIRSSSARYGGRASQMEPIVESSGMVCSSLTGRVDSLLADSPSRAIAAPGRCNLTSLATTRCDAWFQ